MPLEDLNKKLHGRDLHFDRDHKPDAFDPAEALPNRDTLSQFTNTETWVEPPKPLAAALKTLTFEDISAKKRRKRIALALGSIALILLLGGAFFKIRSILFSEEKILTTFSGPQDVASAELTTFSLQYTNNNWIDLENATLVFTYPEIFQPEPDATLQINTSRAEATIGTIPAHSMGKKNITGKFYGSKGDKVVIQATLRYNQKDVSSTLTKSSEITVNVATSPLAIEISAPQELASGQDIQYTILYQNTGDIEFSNIKVRLKYPEGFHFVSADPKPTEEDNIWQVGDITAHAEGKIIVRGTLQGARDEYRVMDAEIGFFQGDGKFVAYSENQRKTRIIASPLTIKQTVNGMAEANASLGELLSYVITFKNEGNVGVRDVIVTVDIDSPLLDFSRLQLPTKGAYDVKKKMLIWKASDIPRLASMAPGQEGEIRFSVPLVGALPEGMSAEKNTAIKTIAKIDSPDIPAAIDTNKIIGSNISYVSVNTKVDALIQAFYNDATISNSGPVPPKVGQETTYTVHLTFTNTFNEVTNARAVVSFPTEARYTGKSSPENEKIVFNERTNELVWDLGTFSPTSSRSLVFQIAATPSPNQAGQELPLLNSMSFTGKDAFTQKDIKLEKSGKTSNIPEDTSLPVGSATVQP